MRTTTLYKAGGVRFEERADLEILAPTDALTHYVGVPHGPSIEGQRSLFAHVDSSAARTICEDA